MKLTTVHLYDWAGIYSEDGKLLTEGHSIRYDEALEALGHKIEHLDIDEDDALDKFGNRLPASLNDLKAYIIERRRG